MLVVTFFVGLVIGIVGTLVTIKTSISLKLKSKSTNKNKKSPYSDINFADTKIKKVENF